MTRTSLIVLALTLGACGGGGYGPASFVTDYGKAICEKNFSCCSSTDVGTNTRADCEQTYSMMAGTYEAQVKDAESKGRLVFHADKAKACVATLRAATCASWPQAYADSEACVDQAIEPKVAAGGKCNDDSQCVSSWCSGTSTDQNGNTTDGTCTAFVAVGGTCTVDDDCIRTAYCESGTCTARKAIGAACFLDSECTSQNCASSTSSTSSQCASMKCYQGCAFAGPTGAAGTLAVLGLLVAAGLRRGRRSRRG